MPSVQFKIDSKPVSVKLSVNPDPKGDLTVDLSSCDLDASAMKYTPIRIRFYHYDNQTSLRKLLWHEDELQTNVSFSTGSRVANPQFVKQSIMAGSSN